jgi:thioredoxin-dependent peroxiredoxin
MPDTLLARQAAPEPRARCGDYTIGREAHGTLERRSHPIHSRRRMAVIDTGQKAPAFSLPDQNGQTHTLTAYAGRPVVLYFYPKDDTPGCTTEACTFEAGLAAFTKLEAVVLGVSVLDSASKARFAKKHGLTFPLLADADHAVADAYGAWQEKSMYGRQYMGVARITYLIDREGRIAQRWDTVKPADHPAEVLEAIRGL